MQIDTTMTFTNLAELTVDEKREIFMRRTGWTLGYLAECLGIEPSTLSRALRNDTMRTTHHKTLVNMGMPPELLPEPMDIKPGPKPKHTAA